ncbi:secretory lipase protein [Rutstroemia sp. NJR-2017a WRK4]|nr:secretory lipase protein [Rutstroemia sp. NJR-2017a WRK4]
MTSKVASLPSNIQAALDYERSNWANGSVKEDPFYTLPGTLIKLQEDANASNYTLPPNTAISRFIYQSKDLNDNLVPVSAYILWPFLPRRQSDGYQVVAWAHGTSGISAECAPSHFRNLWQHYLAPYQLLLQGYVIIATDYAGLGVGKNESEEPIVHQYFAHSAAANDVIYSVQAARQAFPQLSKDFVVIGHSQGGGVAWAVAQKHAISKIPGYLGAVAVSPITNILGAPDPIGTIIGAAMGPGIASAFPEFKLEDIFLPEGLAALQQLLALEGCSPVGNIMLLGPLMTGNLLKPDWRSNPWVIKYNSITRNGGQKIGGPLLVVHGEIDPLIDFNLTAEAVNATVSLYSSSQLEFLRLPNTTHVSALTGSQRVWMDWIAGRFAGLEVKPYSESSDSTVVHARPASTYGSELNWYIELATESYETP